MFSGQFYIKELRREIEVNWTQMDLSIEGLLACPMIDLSYLYNRCLSLEYDDLDFSGLDGVKEIGLKSLFPRLLELKGNKNYKL